MTTKISIEVTKLSTLTGGTAFFYNFLIILMKYLSFGHNLDKLFRYNKDIKEERSELDGVVIGRNFLADAAGVRIK